MRREMPNLGEVLVIGQLHAMGYAVSRQRVRNAIHATNPLNTALGWQLDGRIEWLAQTLYGMYIGMCSIYIHVYVCAEQ